MNRINFDYSLSSKKDFISIGVFFELLNRLLRKRVKNDIFNIGGGSDGYKVMNIVRLFLGKKFYSIPSYINNEKELSQTLNLSKLSSKIEFSESKNSKRILNTIKKCGKLFF